MTRPLTRSLVLALLVSGSLLAQPVPFRLPEEPSVKDFFNAKIFEEVLVPLGQPKARDSVALARLLENYVAEGKLSKLAPFSVYVNDHPNSAWNLALLVDVGLMQRHVGSTSLAVEAWEEAWKRGKTVRKDPVHSLVNRALGELLEVHAGLGNRTRLEELIKEAETRSLSGLVTEKLSAAREALTRMKSNPEEAYRCGPVALTYLKAASDPFAFIAPVFEGMLATEHGTSLADNARWARDAGLNLQMAKKKAGAAFVPGVVHLRLGHFVALMAVRDGRYLLQDPFLGDVWVTQAILDRESSGYALIPSGPLAEGWAAVLPEEGATILGKGAWGPGRPDDTRPDSRKVGVKTGAQRIGIPSFAFHANVVSLNVDTCVSNHSPAPGPHVEFRITYNQREYGQPQVFDYCNLGPKWTFSYLACLRDDTTNPWFDIELCNPGGGGKLFQSNGDGTYRPEGATGARLTKVSSNAYTIQYLDGRVEYYDMPDRAWGLRRLVLTHIRDAAGKEVKLTWDPKLRLCSVTDAAGNKTTLSYELASDPLKVTRIIDPAGRAMTLNFSPEGQLSKVVNGAGEVTTFTYGPTRTHAGLPADFMNAMTTPDGTYQFAGGEEIVAPAHRRWLESTAPNGQRERAEGAPGYAYVIPPEPLPNAPEFARADRPEYHPLVYSFRELFYWDAKAMEAPRPSYPLALNILWGHGPGGFSSGLVLSEKNGSAPRHWFVHAGEFWGGVHPAAKAPEHPLAPNGALRPGRAVPGSVVSPEKAGLLVPVYDGTTNRVTRDYWLDGSKKLHVIACDFDLSGHLLRELPDGEVPQETHASDNH